MANPIIKIKRGFGIPGTWNSADGTGITAGEFGFDRTTATLYLGLSGGGFKSDGTINPGGNAPIVVPIGMQISNDATFAQAVGYSQYTVPTTKAVKDYVSFVKQAAVSGYTLYAGEGIRLDYFDPNNIDQGLTIVNTGVIKGFTSFGLGGNFSGNARVFAANATDGLTLTAGSGIKIIGDNANRTLSFINEGVTGINGYTGNITTFTPFVLSGFTQAVGIATNSNISHILPINIVKTDTGLMEISHQDSGVVAGTYSAFSGNKWYVPNIQVTGKGHIQNLAYQELVITPSSISGITQTVQDIVFKNFNTADGLTLVYDDSFDRATLFNRGITSLAASGSPGITGNVIIAGSGGINVTSAGKIITVTNNSPAFANTALKKGSELNNTGVWVGGIANGAGNAADAINDTLTLYAGKGIGLSAGESSLNSDYLLIWNSGINTISLKDSAGNNVTDGQGLSGDLVLAAGSNISFNVVPVENKISISASGGGSGTGSLVGDYKFEGTSTGLTQQYVGNGVTGIIDVVGLNGIITKQDTQTTANGDLYIGLSSRLSLPARQFPGYEADPTNTDNGNAFDLPANYPAFIRVPTTAETTGSVDAYSGVLPALPIFVPVAGTNPTFVNTGLASGYNRIEVEEIQSGMTANITSGQGNAWGLLNLDPPNEVVPGKVLRLVAKSGSWEDQSGLSLLQGNQAEIRLLGFPAAEHLGSELESIVTSITSSSATYNPCTRNAVGDFIGTGCKGMPTKLPTCVRLDAIAPTVDGFALSDDYSPDATANAPTTKFNTNVVVTESVLVHKDIWLAGNILNANTGCLLFGPDTPPGTNSNATTCIECLGNGNVGITGFARVDGDLYVKGNTVNFTGKGGQTFSADFNVIHIGGLTGDKLLAGSNWRTSDRGLVIQNRAGAIATPLATAQNADSLSKSSFVGVIHNTGTFTYIPDAQSAVSQSGGVDIIKYSGTPGPAHFSAINGVGITNDVSVNAGAATFRVGSPSSLSTNAELKGSVTLQGQSSGRQTINIANQSALINFGSSAQVVEILRGITFDAQSTNVTNTNSLVIAYQKPSSGAGTGRVTFRSPISSDSWTEVVDIGRHLNAAAGGGNNAYAADSPQQTLYNKTLADNTFIDCGTY